MIYHIKETELRLRGRYILTQIPSHFFVLPLNLTLLFITKHHPLPSLYKEPSPLYHICRQRETGVLNEEKLNFYRKRKRVRVRQRLR